jgi:hypothetical protein
MRRVPCGCTADRGAFRKYCGKPAPIMGKGPVAARYLRAEANTFCGVMMLGTTSPAVFITHSV